MIFFLLVLFILGAIVGSFLNVVVLRLGTGLSIVSGRSRCFSCKKELEAIDLVPVFSYLALRGKCRRCGSKISVQYFLVEIVTAGLFVWAGFSGLPENPASWLLLILTLGIMSYFVAIAAYDVRHHIIPDILSLGAAIVALIYAGILFWQGVSWHVFVAGPLVALPFFLIWLVSRGKWMGLGDAKLSLSIGWWLGISAGFGALVAAIFSGAIFGIGLLIREKIKKGTVTPGGHEMPFGPFLILGAILAYFFGLTVWSFVFGV